MRSHIRTKASGMCSTIALKGRRQKAPIRKLYICPVIFQKCFTFHLRLARKRLIFSFLRDLVGLRVRGVKDTIQGWANASVQDSLDLQSKWTQNTEKKKKKNKDSDLSTAWARPYFGIFTLHVPNHRDKKCKRTLPCWRFCSMQYTQQNELK